jgi:flagellar biosynthesis protein FlhB
MFQTLSLGIFFFSSKSKEKKNKKEKPIEKKTKMQRKEGAYLQALALPSHFWVSLLASCFCLFVSSAFSLAFFFSQAKENKEKHKEQKNHREKENAKKGGSLPFLSRFFVWNEALLLLSPLHIPSTLSFPPTVPQALCLASP